MPKKKPLSPVSTWGEILRSETLLRDVQRHIMSYIGNDFDPPRKDTYFQGLAMAVRDRMVERWLMTQRSFYDSEVKRVYYLSMEFLPGRFMMDNVLKLDMLEESRQALAAVGMELEDLEEEEWDPGLGNGGLGRLASCYLDSMATLGIPGYGCGIRYDYGIFYQKIVDGYQFEQCDNWTRHGNPWEIKRRNFLYEVCFYGRSEPYVDAEGRTRFRWVDAENVMAMACDILIPGYHNDTVNNMRLWAAISSREFNLQEFNEGDYIGAVERKVFSENLSKVLYPRDEKISGKELRLKQQYFFVAATFQDIIRRFKKSHDTFAELPQTVAVQLNDTHPTIAIPELMRILMDEEGLGWEESWDICTQIFAYTNHTVMPEALEVWPAELLGRVLPRHLEIIYEINRRFLEEIAAQYPDDHQRMARMAIVEAHSGPMIRMANLAVVGSHTVNGVSALHTRILKESLFKDFDEHFPGRFRNVTNGITPRRWLLQANPDLAALISEAIGPGWVTSLDDLRGLSAMVDDKEFLRSWRDIKLRNKERLAQYILRKTGITVDPDTLFDVHAKRIHEYKRQLLNILHVVTVYNRMRSGQVSSQVPRTVLFAGKAAAGYYQAKMIIKLINSVAKVINTDPDLKDSMRVVFMPNYCVSQAQKLIAATELSQQISTAGMEASGTGNMKFALNGALTIGTLDGANVEIMEEVGRDNIFIFGLEADEVLKLKSEGYDPQHYYRQDPELKTALDMIRAGHFSPQNPNLFVPVVDELLQRGDRYMVLADYRAYIEAQEQVNRLYLDPDEWTRRSIFNTAGMGKFSSDRAVMQYATEIWNVRPLGKAAGRK